MTEPPSIEENFARRMRERRKQLRISTRTLAERMQERGFDWHHNTVLRTENGQRPVRLNEAFALSVILRTELVQMFRAEKSPKTVKLIKLQIDELSREVVKTSESLKKVEDEYEEARSEYLYVSDRFRRLAERRNELARELSVSMRRLDQLKAQMGTIDAVISDLNSALNGNVDEGDGDRKDGICVDCGAEIPKDRLKILPDAIRCVPCQEIGEWAERVSSGGEESS